jgi:protein-S-isoprenylcysteine O-methyltransferase
MSDTYLWAPGVALGCYLLVELLIRTPGAASSWRPGRSDRGTTAMIVVALVACWLIHPVRAGLGLVGPTLLPPGWRWLCVVGLAVSVAGVGLRVWSMRTLGAAYSRTLRVGEEQDVVQSGPYLRVRHPGYTGSILALTGANLATGSWPAAAIASAILVTAYLIRIRAEERMLVSVFGERYRAYQRRSGRLLPG